METAKLSIQVAIICMDFIAAVQFYIKLKSWSFVDIWNSQVPHHLN